MRAPGTSATSRSTTLALPATRGGMTGQSAGGGPEAASAHITPWHWGPAWTPPSAPAPGTTPNDSCNRTQVDDPSGAAHGRADVVRNTPPENVKSTAAPSRKAATPPDSSRASSRVAAGWRGGGGGGGGRGTAAAALRRAWAWLGLSKSSARAARHPPIPGLASSAPATESHGWLPSGDHCTNSEYRPAQKDASSRRRAAMPRAAAAEPAPHPRARR